MDRYLGDTVLPSLKNGEDLHLYLIMNYKYPKLAIKNKIEGKIFIQVELDDKGNLINTKVLRGLTNECDYEALRVINMIEWYPATINGKPVKINFVIPIKLRLKNQIK